MFPEKDFVSVLEKIRHYKSERGETLLGEEAETVSIEVVCLTVYFIGRVEAKRGEIYLRRLMEGCGGPEGWLIAA